MSENKTMEAPLIESFLLNKKVRIEPVANGSAFKDLLVEKSKAKNQAFLFEGVTKTISVPMDPIRGGLVEVLDNSKRFKTTKFPNDTLTEQEYFERVLEVNLSPYSKDSLFTNDPRGSVVLENRAYTLDLSNPWDYLQYKILLSNKKLVAATYEERFDRPSYKFCIVDEKKVSDKKRENFKSKQTAYAKYDEIAKSKEALEDFIKSMGSKKLPLNYTKEWLEEEIESIIEESPAKFNEIAEDINYKTKVFIYNAVDCGALEKSKNAYSLDTGKELGILRDTVSYFNDPRNQDVKLRIKGLIDNSKL